MAINRETETVETVVERAPLETVEERVVERDGSVTRVVRTVGEPLLEPVVQTVVTRPPAVRRTVSRIWRRSSVPTQAVATEYGAVGGYGGEPSLGQFLRVGWFFLGLLEGLLALRFTLALLGANPDNAFAALVYGLSWPFVAPFRTLFGVPAAAGSVLETYTLVAMVVVLFGWWIAVRLVGVLMNRSVE